MRCYIYHMCMYVFKHNVFNTQYNIYYFHIYVWNNGLFFLLYEDVLFEDEQFLLRGDNVRVPPPSSIVYIIRNCDICIIICIQYHTCIDYNMYNSYTL